MAEQIILKPNQGEVPEAEKVFEVQTTAVKTEDVTIRGLERKLANVNEQIARCSLMKAELEERIKNLKSKLA